MIDRDRLQQLAGIKLSESSANATHQKDWIVYDFKRRNLFCIAIVQDSNGWHLLEFVNFFNMSSDKFREVVSMGYMTMIDAGMDRKNYEYVIADHPFNKEDVDTDYWHGLVPEEKFWEKASTFKAIDKNEFEREMKKLVGKTLFKGK